MHTPPQIPHESERPTQAVQSAVASEPWPYNRAEWPIVQVYLVRKAVAVGARVRAEALGTMCSNCGNTHLGNAEFLTYFGPGGDIWPLVVCDGCRAEFRADYENCALRMVNRVLAKFGAVMNGMQRKAS
jgi:hypothetical protein